MAFSRRGSITAAENDQGPSILQLNTEEVMVSEVSVFEQVALKNKALVVVLQETHCRTADRLVILYFSLAGSVLSMDHGLAKFFTSSWNGHWSICLQSNQTLNVYKPPPSPLTPVRPSRRFHAPVCMLASASTSTVFWHISWRREPRLVGSSQQPYAAQPKGSNQRLLSPMGSRHKSGSGIRGWRQCQPAACQTCSRKVPAATKLTLSHNATEVQDSCLQPTTICWSDDNFTRLIGITFAFIQENPLRDWYLWTEQTSRAHTWSYARGCYFPTNNLSNVAVARILCQVGTKSAGYFIAPSSELQYELTLTEPLHPLFRDLTGKRREQKQEVVNPINFMHSSRKVWSTNKKLTWMSGHAVCAPSQQNPSPRNSWITGQTRQWSARQEARQRGGAPPVKGPNTWGK